MIENIERLLKQIFQSMTETAPSHWNNLELLVTAAGSSMDLSSVAISKEGGRITFSGNALGDASCMELREVMYQDGKGTWYGGKFLIDQFGNCETQYDYDSSPFQGDLDGDVRRLLIEDQELFPRDQKFLPEWHPCRAKP
jgi:hypothetical protein